MGFRRLALTALFFLVTGCATGDRSMMTTHTYPHSHSFYDLRVSWETTGARGSVTIDGTLKNQSYYYLSDPEITATLLDANGNIIGEGTFLFFPHQFSLDEIAPFTIRIPVKEGEVPKRIRFTYRYRLAEEGMSGSPRFNSFEATP